MPSSSMAIIHEMNEAVDNDDCPNYEVAISRSNSYATTAASGSVKWSGPSDEPPAPLQIQPRPPRPLPRHERYLYTYNLVAGATPMQFLISTEPASGKPSRGKCTFRLSLKANGIERPLGEPIALQLSVDPRKLEYVVFVFPGKNSIPTGCLYSYRVWLRVNGIDHRLFGEDDLWIGKDPDFASIGDASFARLKSVDTHKQLYHGFVGRALVTFIVRWRSLSDGYYRYSLDYEANGVGGKLFDDYRIRLDGDPRTVTFLIYSVPLNSQPVGASHRMRVWLRSLVSLSSTDPSTSFGLPFNDSYIYQRIWKSDSFKIGSRLDFSSLGSKVVMGFSAGGPQTIIMSEPPRETTARTAYEEKVQAGLDLY